MSLVATLASEVGSRIRQLRDGVGISQEELAGRAGLHRNYVGSLERGERDVGLSALHRLVTALGTTLTEFFADIPSGRKSGTRR
jgi:transcriptional regulator with XRE-family HTH domain